MPELPEPADPGNIALGCKIGHTIEKNFGICDESGNTPQARPFPQGGPYADWFDVVKSYCDGYVNNSAQTMFPGIAWTGAHTFSILGVHNERRKMDNGS